MKKVFLFLTLLFSCAVFSLHAEDKDWSDIELKELTDLSGTQSLVPRQLPMSASYTSDTLYVEFNDYEGTAVVSVTDVMTGSVLHRTISKVTSSEPTIELDITDLPTGYYQLSIRLRTQEEYGGFFSVIIPQSYCCQRHKTLFAY